MAMKCVMSVERMAELAEVRLLELGLDGFAGDCISDVEREIGYVASFCGQDNLDEELCLIVVELAAASILEREALAEEGEVKSLGMGDVSVSYARSGAEGRQNLAAMVFRRAIVRLAARRGIRW